jgi:hypothetical protein
LDALEVGDPAKGQSMTVLYWLMIGAAFFFICKFMVDRWGPM